MDGWRAIAALMVVAGHIQSDSSVAWTSEHAAFYARLGVEYFFGISGFVIARGLLQGSTLGSFYIRRAFRILPPLLMYVGAIVALTAAGVLPSWAYGTLKALTFTCNNHKCGGWFGGHTWSLSVEEQFYLVIPALLLLAPRRFVTPIALAVPATVLGLYALRQPGIGGFVSDFDVIWAGVLVALYEPLVVPRLAKAPTVIAPLAIVATVAISALGAGAVPAILRTLALPALIMIALVMSAFGPLRRFFAFTPLRKFGEASYGFYLWQQLVTYAWPHAGWPFYIVGVVLCGASALAAHAWIERPLIGLGRRLAERVRGPGMIVQRAPAE